MRKREFPFFHNSSKTTRRNCFKKVANVCCKNRNSLGLVNGNKQNTPENIRNASKLSINLLGAQSFCNIILYYT